MNASSLSADQLEQLRRSHVYVCLPCYGGMLTEPTLRGMLDLSQHAQAGKIPWTLQTLAHESLVPRARNNLVAIAMSDPACTHVLFVDADIRFKAADVFTLVLHAVDVIGGCCPLKKEPVVYALNPLPGGQRDGDRLEVTTIGTGFVLIARNALQRMFDGYPETKYVDSMGLGAGYEPFMYALFDTAIDPAGRYLSEDWTFCIRWRNLGGAVWADRSLRLGHVGQTLYTGDDAILSQL